MKLVRDTIPEIVKKINPKVEFEQVTQEEILSLLLEKLTEEALEVKNTKNDTDLKEELADVLEVVDAIMDRKNFQIQEIQTIQIQKAKMKGKFKNGWVLK